MSGIVVGVEVLLPDRYASEIRAEPGVVVSVEGDWAMVDRGRWGQFGLLVADLRPAHVLEHIIELTGAGWTLMHPLQCRPDLFACEVNRAAQDSLTEVPECGPGRFWCGIDWSGEFRIGDRTERAASATDLVLVEVAAERRRQDERWGEQNHPLVDPAMAGRPLQLVALQHEIPTALRGRDLCQKAAERGELTWAHILVEEVAEFVGTEPRDTAAVRAELVQIAAVAVAAIESLDRAGGVMRDA
ncbi:MAG TPA: hypothetical protein VF163_02480 [Micromonosporaceae bacterium]